MPLHLSRSQNTPRLAMRSSDGGCLTHNVAFLELIQFGIPPEMNEKPVMSKPAQLAKLIELRKDLRQESQNSWYRSDLSRDFLSVGLAAGVCAYVSGASASDS